MKTSLKNKETSKEKTVTRKKVVKAPVPSQRVSSQKTTQKNPLSRVVKPVVVTKAKKVSRTATSRITKPLKRYGKQTLRAILLSKMFHAGFKVVVGLALFGSVSYGGYHYISNTVAHDVVVSKSEIVARIAKRMELPEGSPDAVVRVQDPETLKKQNGFYENVKEGDYIVMYPKMAVIYDLRNDSIVASKKSDQ